MVDLAGQPTNLLGDFTVVPFIVGKLDIVENRM
jgi:hypothetical protein